MTCDQPDYVHLRTAGTSLVIDLSDGRLPRILHWGTELPGHEASDVATLARMRAPWIGDSAVTYPHPVPVLPQRAEGWLERPGLAGRRPDGSAWAPLFTLSGVQVDQDARSVQVRASDPASGLDLELVLQLTDEGLVTLGGALVNVGDSPYELSCFELSLPVPDLAAELFDLAGRWSRERVPQRSEFGVGQWVREARGGKPGLESIGVLAAGERGFGFGAGQVWLCHLAWPGSQIMHATRTHFDWRALGGAEILEPGEVILAPGQRYQAPVLMGAWGHGLDQASGRFHQYLRRGTPNRTRPVTVNTWEAVYFDQDETTITELATRAAEIGAERFVIDDGWFTGRTDSTSSLGDWQVCERRWPHGLRQIADHVHGLGMELGLWVEPEMVNPDSQLARDHPEWLFDAGHGPGMTSRYQWVLDLAHPQAYDHVFEAISELIGTYRIDALKWDHNRYLLDCGHQPGGTPGQRAQTLAAARMMRALVARHPGLSIESCASGSGRTDLMTLQVANRIWPSDVNDPLERVQIVRWAQLLLPNEMLGTHVGASPDHITGRQFEVGQRAIQAVWGNMGIETDLTKLDADELAELAGWVEVHKQIRTITSSGRLVHADQLGAHQCDGAITPGQAVYLVSQRDRALTFPDARLRLVGLDPQQRYRVRVLASAPSGIAWPPWASTELVTHGGTLEHVGLEMPNLPPGGAFLLSVQAC